MNGVSILVVLRTKWPWLLGCFCIVAIVTWLTLGALASPTFLSTGLVELGYFNPRDYQPHPIMSTRAVAGLIDDPSFAARVAGLIDQQSRPIKGVFRLSSAPLEEGLLRVEVRAENGRLAQEVAAIACSLVVAITGEDYQREEEIMNSQLEMVRGRSAIAESLIMKPPVGGQQGIVQGDALRALAHLTEIQMEKEIDAELTRQKKRSVVVVQPGPGVVERPPLFVMSLGPALVVTVLLAAGFVAKESGNAEPQI